jgi:hypothetical protein
MSTCNVSSNYVLNICDRVDKYMQVQVEDEQNGEVRLEWKTVRGFNEEPYGFFVPYED